MLSYMKLLSHCGFILITNLFLHNAAFGHFSMPVNPRMEENLPGADDSLERISEELKSYLKEGNAKNIAKYFASNITLSISGENGIYTKYQSEIMLGTFFNQHKPKTVKLTQSSKANNGYQYFTYSLATEQANYRVFVKIGAGSNNHSIEELRIDKN